MISTKRAHRIQRLALLLLCVLSLLLTSCDVGDWLSGSSDQAVPSDGTLNVHFLDVGQGDSALLMTGNGSVILIDAGPNASQNDLLSALEDLNVKKIDCMILSHSHEDHIGGADVVIQRYPIGSILMPDVISTSSTFEKLLTLIEQKDLEITIASPTDRYQIDDVLLSILGPIEPIEDEGNNASIVLRVDHGEVSFLFSGDAESESEEAIIKAHRSKLDCDVYKVGHHGSSTSSSEEFIGAISPKIAIISCGRDNQYSHPHKQTLDRLTKAGATIRRTDVEGRITLVSDGKSVA